MNGDFCRSSFSVGKCRPASAVAILRLTCFRLRSGASDVSVIAASPNWRACRGGKSATWCAPTPDRGRKPRGRTSPKERRDRWDGLSSPRPALHRHRGDGPVFDERAVFEFRWRRAAVNGNPFDVGDEGVEAIDVCFHVTEESLASKDKGHDGDLLFNVVGNRPSPQPGRFCSLMRRSVNGQGVPKGCSRLRGAIGYWLGSLFMENGAYREQ